MKRFFISTLMVLLLIISLTTITNVSVPQFSGVAVAQEAEGSKLPKLKVSEEPAANSGKICGDPDTNASLTPTIDLGCRGKGNGILDLTFAIVRLMSLGVGLVVIGSMVVAGIQFTASRGDPQGTASSLKRIQHTVLALLLYIFAYAILNWLLPGAVLK